MMQEMRLRNYSERTIITYISLVRQVYKFYNLSPDKLSIQQIKDYLDSRIIKDKISVSAINQTISAFKVLFVYVLKREWNNIEISRPRREFKLPVVLSEYEITRVLSGAQNLKHKAIIALTYSSGIRLSEVCNIKIKDIDSSRMLVRVNNGKGKKDRYTILSQKTLKILREYYKNYRPVDYLFYGYNKKLAISRGTVQKAFKTNIKKAGILKDVHFHTLRHSFATHLLEQNINLKVIQKLLGHGSIKTTMLYTHLVNFKISSVKSPFDNF
jgi:site-specific recombinase XerD